MVEQEQYLVKKVDSIETRLESHVSKIEQRLDQIVDIMQAVAKLQEKESINSESIKELKQQLKESVVKFESASLRLHERLDKIDEANNREYRNIRNEDAALNTRIEEVENKVDRWMNRGVGIWIGISTFVVILQTIGGLVLSSFKDEYANLKTMINEINKKQISLEQEIFILKNKK